MMHVITGGSGSGKSAWAEEKILEFQGNCRIYIATMFPYDEESRLRIQRHRNMRAKKQFETVECYKDLHTLALPKEADVLLECMSNLTANEMFWEDGAGKDTEEQIMRGVEALRRQVRNLVIVTNEIFSDGIQYDEGTRAYQQTLGRINSRMAAAADRVTEVVYGIPVTLKG